nr:DUF167 family protein [Aurantimonas sp. CSK15Z-1]
MTGQEIPAFAELRDGALRIHVRLTPKAASDRIDGVAAGSDGRGALLARVRALPEKGAANAALLSLLAKALKRPKSSLSLDAGAAARIKTVRVTGEADDLVAALSRLRLALPDVEPGGG